MSSSHIVRVSYQLAGLISGASERGGSRAAAAGRVLGRCAVGTALRAVAELIAGSGKLIRLCRWPGGLASAGQAGQGLGGEVPGGQGPEQVVYGAGESPFGGSLVLAAHAQ